MYKGWSETAHSLGTPKKRVFKQSAGKSKENEGGWARLECPTLCQTEFYVGHVSFENIQVPCELWKYTRAMRALWYVGTCNSWVEGVNAKVGTKDFTLCSSSQCALSSKYESSCPVSSVPVSNIVSKIGGCMSVKRKAWTNLWLCNFILHIPCCK